MTATYDAANRMSTVTLSIGGTSKSSTLTHDANGNLTRKQNTTDSADTTTYTWDSNNRLTQITQPGLTASFSYDAFGRRIQSSITKGGNTSTVQHLYEGLQSLGEIRDSKLSHRLLTGLSLDETIARMAINTSGNKDAATSRVYMTDALNSVIAQLNDEDSANVANSYAYSPYGESQTIGPDSTNNPIQYTSRENDGTGLMYYRARYYDPLGKGFSSDDPIGLEGGFNLPAYVGGNPLILADPDGLRPNMPKWWNDGWAPKMPPGHCATAECAAGFGQTSPTGSLGSTEGLTCTARIGVGLGVTASYNTSRGLTYLGAGPQAGLSVSITGGGKVLTTGSGAQGVVIQASGAFGNGVVGISGNSAIGTGGTTTTVSPGVGTIGVSVGVTMGYRR